MAPPAPTLPVGVLGRAHGLGGEIALRPFDPASDLPLRLASVALVSSDGRRRDARMSSVRRTSAGFLVRFDGVESRSAAQAIVGCAVHVDRAEMPPLGPGDFYVEDLNGCTVVTEGGALLGTVAGTFWNGAHDVMTVRGGAGPDRLLPVVPAHIVAFDGAARQVTVRWPASDDE